MSDSRLTRIEDKIDAIYDELVQVKLGYQEHERRSLANEKAVETLRSEFKPVHELLLQVRFLHRIILWIAGSAGFVYTILEIKSLLGK